MNNEKQRIAIAEACGWTREYADVPTWNAELNSFKGGYEPIHTLVFRRKEKGVLAENLPDYLNDLNAMHEAENILDANQRVKYASLITRQFIDEIYQVIPNNLNFPICFPAINVKAEVKAENFLRAIGKWEEEA